MPLSEAIGHQDDPQVRLSTAEVMTVPLVSAAFFSGNIDKTRLFVLEYGYMKEMVSKSETSPVTTQRLGGARVGRKLGC